MRFWFSPAWTSVSLGGQGIGQTVTLLEAGSWSATTSHPQWSLVVNGEATTIQLVVQAARRATGLLEAPVGWRAGEWHQIAVAWSVDGVALYVDGVRETHAPGAKLPTPSQADGTPGISLGSGLNGVALSQGIFDELYSFARVCSDEEFAADYDRSVSLAALGPLTPEEEIQWRVAGAAARAAAASQVSVAPPLSPERQSMLESMGDCASELAISKSGTTVTQTVQNATPGKYYDVFRSMHLTGDWRWVAKRMNGQNLVLQEPRCPGFYVLGCDQDTDTDGLTAAGNLALQRSNSAAGDDFFNVFPFPVVAVNPDPAKAGHLYVTYTDVGQTPGDKADIFLVRSVNHGATWTAPGRATVSPQTINGCRFWPSSRTAHSCSSPGTTGAMIPITPLSTFMAVGAQSQATAL